MGEVNESVRANRRVARARLDGDGPADQDETSEVMGTAPLGAFGSTFWLYLP
jgi:hypothetical protein